MYTKDPTIDETDEEISNLARRVGTQGFVWQFNPQAGFYATGVAMHQFAQAMHKKHMLPYIRMLEQGEQESVSIVDWYEQAGDLTDALTDLLV